MPTTVRGVRFAAGLRAAGDFAIAPIRFRLWKVSRGRGINRRSRRQFFATLKPVRKCRQATHL